jgi:hypothetical protein
MAQTLAKPSTPCHSEQKMLRTSQNDKQKKQKQAIKKKNQERINAQVKLIRSRMKKRESSP